MVLYDWFWPLVCPVLPKTSSHKINLKHQKHGVDFSSLNCFRNSIGYTAFCIPTLMLKQVSQYTFLLLIQLRPIYNSNI